MRFLIKASWEVEAGNALARKGTLGTTVQSILAENGKRTAFLIVDMQDASQLPAVAEPWFLATNATIEATPVMLAEDLEKAGPAIQQAVEKYG